MFLREANPFFGDNTEQASEELVKWLELKLDKEKLLCIAQTANYFIFMDFDQFCKASMLVQTKVTERMKR